jgi:hypothetical protein
MIDFLEREIKIDDEVIYLKRMIAPGGSRRNVMFKGKVLGFTVKNVKIVREYTNESFPTMEVDYVLPWRICKLETINEKEIDEDGTLYIKPISPSFVADRIILRANNPHPKFLKNDTILNTPCVKALASYIQKLKDDNEKLSTENERLIKYLEE